jgi:hypothetical protein
MLADQRGQYHPRKRMGYGFKLRRDRIAYEVKRNANSESAKEDAQSLS